MFATIVQEQECQKRAISLVAAYIHQLPKDEPRQLAIEVSCDAPRVDPVSGEDLGIPLVGVMDLVLPEEEGPLITDFKTASTSSGPLEIAHEVQLSCYSYLFRHASPEPEAGLEIRNLVKTKTPQIQFHLFCLVGFRWSEQSRPPDAGSCGWPWWRIRRDELAFGGAGRIRQAFLLGRGGNRIVNPARQPRARARVRSQIFARLDGTLRFRSRCAKRGEARGREQIVASLWQERRKRRLAESRLSGRRGVNRRVG